MDYYIPADPVFQKIQKSKARELRQSQWWRQQLGQGICYHCELRFPTAELTMDHLIPISRGGKSDRKNCVPSCKACNTKKGSKTRAELVLESLDAANLEKIADSIDQIASKGSEF